MKKLSIGLIGLVLVFGCGRPTARRQTAKSEFTNDVVLKTTPVIDQGRSPLCWDYAMLATIETEHLMQGDSVHLSPDYVARALLQEEAERAFFARPHQRVSLRGMASMTINLIERHGLVPYDSYYNTQPVDYFVMQRIATQIARASSSLTMLGSRMENAMDERIGYLPGTIMMLGAEYTPLEFAHSVCRPGEYTAMTSFTHHPFGQKFVLEVPDNQMQDRFLDVPLDTMMHAIVRAIRHGHPVCWEGDTSEPGFDFVNGTATLPDDYAAPSHGNTAMPDDATITPQRRQREFETLLTTDDHCMELCGLAHDRQGRRYFIAKNSWGKGNRFAGFMYLSYNYVKLKTIAVYLKQH